MCAPLKRCEVTFISSILPFAVWGGVKLDILLGIKHIDLCIQVFKVEIHGHRHIGIGEFTQ